MSESPIRRSTPGPDDMLWTALSRYTVGPDDAALSFAARLARDNGWSAAMAGRVIDEYRRFAYLAVRAGHSVTPSDAVDQAWHLHLTYSHDYWDRFCPLLGQPLHHGPTKGGAAEEARFFEAYAETMRSYERLFGEAPPADIWPDARRRLRDDPRARRVHPREGLVLPRPALATIVAAAAALGFGMAWLLLLLKGE